MLMVWKWYLCTCYIFTEIEKVGKFLQSTCCWKDCIAVNPVAKLSMSQRDASHIIIYFKSRTRYHNFLMLILGYSFLILTIVENSVVFFYVLFPIFSSNFSIKFLNDQDFGMSSVVKIHVSLNSTFSSSQFNSNILYGIVTAYCFFWGRGWGNIFCDNFYCMNLSFFFRLIKLPVC